MGVGWGCLGEVLFGIRSRKVIFFCVIGVVDEKGGFELGILGFFEFGRG